MEMVCLWQGKIKWFLLLYAALGNALVTWGVWSAVACYACCRFTTGQFSTGAACGAQTRWPSFSTVCGAELERQQDGALEIGRFLRNAAAEAAASS